MPATNLQKACKRAIESYQDLNMYKLNIVLYFMNKLHEFKLNEPFFTEEFKTEGEMGPFLDEVKEAYGQYNLYNIPEFGANNIFDEEYIVTLNEKNEIATEDDKKTHEIVVDWNQDGTYTEMNMSFDKQVQEDIFEFIKASMEPLETTGLLYFYENSKDPKQKVELFLSDKLAEYLKVKQAGFPEPDKSKQIETLDREDIKNEITVEEVMARLNRAKKPL